VSVIDTEKNEVVNTISVGAQPLGIAVDADNDRVYVVNHKDLSLSVIDLKTSKVVNTVNLSLTDRNSSYVGAPWGVEVIK
jgi:YVTN family beta-propeller protein